MTEGYEADYEHEFGGEELIHKLKERGYRPQRSWSFERMVERFNPEEHQVIVIPHLKMVDIDKRW